MALSPLGFAGIFPMCAATFKIAGLPEQSRSGECGCALE
jgi:hypothetical protein